MKLIAGFCLLFLLGTPAMAAKPDITYCTQAHDAAVAHLRWALAPRRSSSVLQTDESCRTYRSEFYEAAVTRQNITHCEQEDVRQHALDVLDAEINAFNDLIATHCGEGVQNTTGL
jgi:hypothetical protein